MKNGRFSDAQIMGILKQTVSKYALDLCGCAFTSMKHSSNAEL